MPLVFEKLPRKEWHQQTQNKIASIGFLDFFPLATKLKPKLKVNDKHFWPLGRLIQHYKKLNAAHF